MGSTLACANKCLFLPQGVGLSIKQWANSLGGAPSPCHVLGPIKLGKGFVPLKGQCLERGSILHFVIGTYVKDVHT